MRLIDSLFSPFFFTLFSSVCFSYLFFFCLNLDLYPFLFHVDFIEARSHWHSVRSLALWSIIYFSQVMNPTSSTISTTQRPRKTSSRSNPATRRVTRPSAERSLRRSFRSEKNQRAEDKLITLFEESSLSSQSLSVCHVRTGRLVSGEFGSLSSKRQRKSTSRLRK